MARILFRRAGSGQRLVRGELVRRAQIGLRAKGADPGEIDGVFGGDTERALRGWQLASSREVTGAMSFDDWTTITNRPVPSLQGRCLQLTADFEGHGFGKVAGNFDGAWLTWGIIGFTLKHGEIQAVVEEVRARHPQRLSEAFGPLEGELLTAIDGDAGAQEAFGDRISVGAKKYDVLPEWQAAFRTLGRFEEVQAIQLERVETKYWARATRDAQRFGLTSEVGFALCFDIAVQCGGIDEHTEEARIRQRFAQSPPPREQDKRMVIADVVAENSNPRYVEDVRSRKRAIATGTGRIHGAEYTIVDWALDEVPAQPLAG